MKQSSIIILLTMFMSIVNTKAVAHDIEVKNSDGITICYNWINDHQNLAVTFQGNSQKYSGNVVIPESVEYEGKTYNVTEIGNNAFIGCSDLTSITIPANVTSIGFEAFNFCKGLTSVHISDIVAWCNIKFSYLKEENLIKRYFENSNPLSYAKHLYLNGEEITDLVIPNEVTSICDGAFIGFNGLHSVTIHNSVTNIGYSAFQSCGNLTDVTIGNGVTYIGPRAFNNCTGLNAVHISDLAAWCNIVFGLYFDGYLGESTSNPLMYAKHLYLNGEEITDLTIPFGVKAISDRAFINFSALTSVTIPNSVTEIGIRVFSDCTNLTAITIGNGVTSIGNLVFKGCSGLTSVTIPNSVTKIGVSAFERCTNLMEITIGSGVTSIGHHAFAYINGARTDNDVLKVFCKAETVPETASNTFENSKIDQGILIVPDNAVAAYQAVAPWNGFSTISGETEYSSIGGIYMNSVNARIYDLRGNHLENLQKGVNIIKMNNGTIKKVFVK